jgi:hypothetical protein
MHVSELAGEKGYATEWWNVLDVRSSLFNSILFSKIYRPLFCKNAELWEELQSDIKLAFFHLRDVHAYSLQVSRSLKETV